MTKSLRELQLKKQVLDLLKSKVKPIYMRAIAQHLEFLHGEELGEFWTLKLQETVEGLLKDGVLLEVRIRNLKAYKHADPAPDGTQLAPAIAASKLIVLTTRPTTSRRVTCQRGVVRWRIQRANLLGLGAEMSQTIWTRGWPSPKGKCCFCGVNDATHWFGDTSVALCNADECQMACNSMWLEEQAMLTEQGDQE